MCPTLSSQWSICAHPQALAVLQVPLCATASEAHRQWCTVRDMIHEVRAEPLDHRTRSAGLETGEACQRTSHPPQLQVCSTCYGSGTTAPSGSHLPREGYPLKRNPVVEAPCPGPSDAGVGGVHKVRASKGQVWTRHCAPAAPAFTQPSSPSQYIACSTGQQMFHWPRALLPVLLGSGVESGTSGGGGGVPPKRDTNPQCDGLAGDRFLWWYSGPPE